MYGFVFEEFRCSQWDSSGDEKKHDTTAAMAERYGYQVVRDFFWNWYCLIDYLKIN